MQNIKNYSTHNYETVMEYLEDTIVWNTIITGSFILSCYLNVYPAISSNIDVIKHATVWDTGNRKYWISNDSDDNIKNIITVNDPSVFADNVFYSAMFRVSVRNGYVVTTCSPIEILERKIASKYLQFNENYPFRTVHMKIQLTDALMNTIRVDHRETNEIPGKYRREERGLRNAMITKISKMITIDVPTDDNIEFHMLKKKDNTGFPIALRSGYGIYEFEHYQNVDLMAQFYDIIESNISPNSNYFMIHIKKTIKNALYTYLHYRESPNYSISLFENEITEQIILILRTLQYLKSSLYEGLFVLD
jgi:hypothetical protein